ncbi:MAG: hypothetical protein MZU79_01115 [Anaerotruncus sp.]|nr:hypothetical protein [Anaerotruncus sp.]
MTLRRIQVAPRTHRSGGHCTPFGAGTRALFGALSSFVDESRLQPHDADDQPLIPTNSAIVFFEDKQLLAVKVRLEYERDANNNMNLISLWQLAALIERVQNVEEFNVAIASVDAPYVPDTIDPSWDFPRPRSLTSLMGTDRVPLRSYRPQTGLQCIRTQIRFHSPVPARNHRRSCGTRRLAYPILRGTEESQQRKFRNR